MGRATLEGVARPPLTGVGWPRVARALAEVLPPAEVEAIWLFAPMRREDREWGTAVVVRHGEDERCRIYTASYAAVVGGPERGQHKVVIEEVGEGPADVVRGILAGVRERTGESEPPLRIAPEAWYGADDDEPAPES